VLNDYINVYLPSYISVRLIETATVDAAIFLAIRFELTNSHLLQQKLMPAFHDSDVTVT